MMAVKQVQTRALMRDVLGESYLSFELRGVEQGEDLVDGRLSFIATLVNSRRPWHDLT